MTAIAGGADASVVVGFMKGWEALRVLSYAGCRPFSRDRDGLTIGEGAGVLVLESKRSRAAARGATAVDGGRRVRGMSADAADVTSWPRMPGGAARAMQHRA